MFRKAICCLALAAILPSAAAAADENQTNDLLRGKDELLQSAARENSALQEKLRLLQQQSITAPELQTRMKSRLREIAADVRQQRQAMIEFQGYVSWMTGNVAGYSKYIEASSIAANFARILPIPYAGQAGMFTKFVSHFTLSLNSAATAIFRYLNSSGQFLARMDGLEKHAAPDRELEELARFADDQLLKDMTDAQTKLATTAELSSSALSFLESLSHYVGSSDEYWNKAKSLIKKGDADKKERSYLAESIATLKTRAGNFDARLKNFNEGIRKDTPLIKGMAAYNDLLRELAARQIPLQTPASPQIVNQLSAAP